MGCCSLSDFPALQGRPTNCDWGTEMELAAADQDQESAAR